MIMTYRRSTKPSGAAARMIRPWICDVVKPQPITNGGLSLRIVVCFQHQPVVSPAATIPSTYSEVERQCAAAPKEGGARDFMQNRQTRATDINGAIMMVIRRQCGASSAGAHHGRQAVTAEADNQRHEGFTQSQAPAS